MYRVEHLNLWMFRIRNHRKTCQRPQTSIFSPKKSHRKTVPWSDFKCKKAIQPNFKWMQVFLMKTLLSFRDPKRESLHNAYEILKNVQLFRVYVTSTMRINNRNANGCRRLEFISFGKRTQLTGLATNYLRLSFLFELRRDHRHCLPRPK